MRDEIETKPWVPGSRLESSLKYRVERQVFSGSLVMEDYLIHIDINQTGLLKPSDEYKITTPTYSTDGPKEMYLGMACLVEQEDGSKYLSARLDIPAYEEPIYCRFDPTVIEAKTEDPANIEHRYKWELSQEDESLSVAPPYPKWEKAKNFFRDTQEYVSDLLFDHRTTREREQERQEREIDEDY